ncbi:MAG: metalloregulator ArsR/SmtB family transcription factor, partial [candidate division Zixibacteria bacterium]
MAKYRNNNWSDFVEISRALGDESRLKILVMLEISEMCVCQITDILKSSRASGLAPSTVSRHLSILHSAG